MGPWLGWIGNVLENVTVLFGDGSVYTIAKADPLQLKPLARPVVDNGSSSYYPGQQVTVVSSSVVESSRWLSSRWKANHGRLDGKVLLVEAASVSVYWFAAAFSGLGTNSETVPASDQDPRNITLLSRFSYSKWHLGDWCLLFDHHPIFKTTLSVENIVTKVDVAWQDGRRENGISSKTLISIHTRNDHEFFPEQYVFENASSDDEEHFRMQRGAIVRNVNSKEQTVCVRWLKQLPSPEAPIEFHRDEVVSAYELEERPDFDYWYGCIVVRSSPASVPADETEGHNNAMEADEAEENLTSLSWVGHITGLQDGYIEVSRADGMVSKVGPQEIFVVGREFVSFDAGSDYSSDVANLETFHDNEILEIAEKEEDPRSPTINTIEMGTKTEVTSENDDNAGTRG